ncbi:MAG: DNA repair protein RecO [Gemmatimonadales bacterium]
MAGTPLLTPAIVLGALRYGETSRIVRLATREHGVVSAIAKGVLRPKSRFGAALQLLSEGQAHMLPSRSSDLHTLVAFDLTATHAGLAHHLDRFVAASALAEVATRFVPPVANASMYDRFRHDIELIELAPPDAIAVVALRAMWRLISALGVGPTVSCCARDGAPLPAADVALSLREGGLLCAACAAQSATTRLDAGDRADFLALLAPGAALPWLSQRDAAAHRRLLLRWVREHLSGDGVMSALEQWAGA